MHCPHCDSTNLKKNGTTAAGSQRYYCKDCDRAFTPSGNGKGGRPAKWETSPERQKAYRERKKQNRRKSTD